LEGKVERFNDTINIQREQKAAGQRKFDDLSEEFDNEGTRQRRLVEEEAKLKAEATVFLGNLFLYLQ
jgi:hypothetical protein